MNNIQSIRTRLEQISKYNGIKSNETEFNNLCQISDELLNTITLNEKLSEIDYNEIKKMLINMYLTGVLSAKNK